MRHVAVVNAIDVKQKSRRIQVYILNLRGGAGKLIKTPNQRSWYERLLLSKPSRLDTGALVLTAGPSSPSLSESCGRRYHHP